ncbi:hypothetical protein RHMOL_Rhmol03G0153600 [Rhododendron molle]|uniref:Uncharacterized protein n=1 Tax=Rhododendron molle TaxID=49168 RepID=A0ACC0PFU6_RHOML|nr:hypothetical protein RHMOL_Rhmol03G0153600 [Rhododendron molle]
MCFCCKISCFRRRSSTSSLNLALPSSTLVVLPVPGFRSVACQSLGPLKTGGVVVGIDVKQQGFSVILSDMCPLVSGISIKDAALSAELGMRALDLAVGSGALSDIDTNDIDRDGQSDGSASGSNDGGVLRPGGHLVIKLLESEDLKEFSRFCKVLFRKASWLRPKATRSSSREIYLICQSLLPLGDHSGEGLNTQPGEQQLKGSTR